MNIRAGFPTVATTHYYPPTDGATIFLDADEAAFAAMQAGDYHEWDCLNQHYVVREIHVLCRVSDCIRTCQRVIDGGAAGNGQS